MIIAFTSTGQDWDSTIDPRFGRTEFILIYNETTKELSCIDNRAVNSVAHGAGPQTAQKLFDLSPDVLITGNGPGDNALMVLKELNIRIITGFGGKSIREAYNDFKNKEIQHA